MLVRHFSETRTLLCLAFVLGFAALVPSAPVYDCTDEVAVCSPNWTELIWQGCAFGPNNKCCIEKAYSYTCYAGGTIHEVVHRHEYNGNDCSIVNANLVCTTET